MEGSDGGRIAGAETPLERLIREAASAGVALDLRTGEFVIATPEQRAMMADPAYQRYVQLLIQMALPRRLHVWLRDVGRA